MKKLLLILMILLSGGVCQAQRYFHFPDSNAMWTETTYLVRWEDDHSDTFHCYVLLNKDTVIHSKKYHKLYRSNDTIIHESDYCGGIREDSLKRVYFYANKKGSYYSYPGVNWYNRDVILFDFSLKVGDTIRNKSSDTVSDKYNMPDNYFMVVTSIDTTYLSGKYRKAINFYNQQYINRWIEGIGNSYGLLVWQGPASPTIGGYWLFYNELECFKQNGKWIYPSDTAQGCFPYIVGIKEAKRDNCGVLFYPNPVSDVSFLKFDNTIHSFEVLEIVSITGEKRKVSLIKNQTMFSIYKRDFSEGIYLYRLIATDGYVVTGKFVIE